MLPKPENQLGQNRRIVAQIRVNHAQTVAVRLPETFHNRAAQPEFAGPVYHLDGIPVSKLLRFLAGTVRRIIVNDDQFNVDLRKLSDGRKNLFRQK